MFWTLAFPLVFIVLFGTIFSASGNPNYKVGWVDEDGSAASAQLRQGFGSVEVFDARRRSVARRGTGIVPQGRRPRGDRGAEGLRRGGRVGAGRRVGRSGRRAVCQPGPGH